MDTWLGKVAVVTGASSGIGAAIVKDLACAGVKTIGLARNCEKIEELKSQLNSEQAKNLFSYKCDVTDEKCVKEIFKIIENKFGGVNILVNNAGCGSSTLILSDEETNDDFKKIVETNLLGVAYCTREAYKQLQKSDDIGYIINISSILGHTIPILPGKPFFNLYPGTKAAVALTSEVIRQELNFLKNNKVRVTSVSPGYTRTEIFKRAGAGAFDELGLPVLEPEDISNVILYILGTPLRVQIKELIIKPTGEMM